MAHLGLGDTILGPQGTLGFYNKGGFPYFSPYFGLPSTGFQEQLAILRQQQKLKEKEGLLGVHYGGLLTAAAAAPGPARPSASPAEATRPESAGMISGSLPAGSGRRPAPPPQTSSFSVSDILSPSFGKKAVQTARRPGSASTPGSPTLHPTPSPAKSWSPLLHQTACVTKTTSTTKNHQKLIDTQRKQSPKRLDSTIQAISRIPSAFCESARTPEAKESESGDNSERSPSAPGGEGMSSKLPAWVYCTRYSDRPSAGPRSRKKSVRKNKECDQKRPRTAFNREQLEILRREFEDNKYLSEERRKRLAEELNLNESQIKIWFQNKRAKVKKCTGSNLSLALELKAQGLYDHSTVKNFSGQDDVTDDSMDT